MSGFGRDPSALTRTVAEPSRPLLLAGGTVLTRDATLGDWASADVLIGAGLVVGVGPGLASAADDDGMIVIDCAGCVVMPAAQGERLAPAEPADVAVYRIVDPDSARAASAPGRSSHLDILIHAGKPVVWNGAEFAEGDAEPVPATRVKLVDVSPDDPRLGQWSDGFLRQHLRPDGRYDEDRGNVANAYCGRFWIDGDRIDYLDDLGFWAFGTFADDRLEHAGYTLRKTK